MMKKTRKYWNERFEEIEKASNKIGIETYSQIEPTFYEAQKNIQKEIDIWYARFAYNNNVSLADAKKILNKKELKELRWDIDQYIKYGKENACDEKWMKELENASAKYHISRLEALKIRTQQAMEVAFGNEVDNIDKMARKILVEDYYKSIFEVQKGFNIGWQIGQIDQRKLDVLVNKPWATDGNNFSSRIWKRKSQMVKGLHQELVRTLVQGKAPDEAIKHLEKFVDRNIKNARNAAARLVMTEQAYFHSVSQKEAFNELDVEEFEIVATLDSHTSDICQDMDGKHFSMKDYELGVTAPPFHVYCRSVTCPYFNDEWSIGERAARDEESGKTYYVPSNMTYSDWKSKMVEGNTDGLKTIDTGNIVNKEKIKELNKLKNSGLKEDDYNAYLDIINKHENESIRKLYSNYADEITDVKFTSSKGAAYSPSENSLTFNCDDNIKYPEMSKYGTLAHEYGHFFDAKAKFTDLHFKEMEEIRNATGSKSTFKNVASASDEFLEAIRKDKEYIKSVFTPEVKQDMIAHNTSCGVQDAIDGLFPKSRIRWGHGEKYYNRKYASVEFKDKVLGGSNYKKALQNVYKSLGLDASNQSKVKTICRQYDASSEAWANIMSAEINGGEELEYVKKYLPNSYKAMLEILKGVQ